jgi:predicted transcriptional regulator
VTYTELADSLNRVLEERRKISSSRSGMLPARGHEEEHERLTKEAEEIRKKMRRARYGTTD